MNKRKLSQVVKINQAIKMIKKEEKMMKKRREIRLSIKSCPSKIKPDTSSERTPFSGVKIAEKMGIGPENAQMKLKERLAFYAGKTHTTLFLALKRFASSATR